MLGKIVAGELCALDPAGERQHQPQRQLAILLGAGGRREREMLGPHNLAAARGIELHRQHAFAAELVQPALGHIIQIEALEPVLLLGLFHQLPGGVGGHHGKPLEAAEANGDVVDQRTGGGVDIARHRRRHQYGELRYPRRSGGRLGHARLGRRIRCPGGAGRRRDHARLGRKMCPLARWRVEFGGEPFGLGIDLHVQVARQQRFQFAIDDLRQVRPACLGMKPHQGSRADLIVPVDLDQPPRGAEQLGAVGSRRQWFDLAAHGGDERLPAFRPAQPRPLRGSRLAILIGQQVAGIEIAKPGDIDPQPLARQLQQLVKIDGEMIAAQPHELPIIFEQPNIVGTLDIANAYQQLPQIGRCDRGLGVLPQELGNGPARNAGCIARIQQIRRERVGLVGNEAPGLPPWQREVCPKGISARSCRSHGARESTTRRPDGRNVGSMLKQEQLIQTARAFNGNLLSRPARVTLVSRLLIAGYAPDHGVARGKHS